MENPTIMMYLGEGGQNNRRKRIITLSTPPLPLENVFNSPRLILKAWVYAFFGYTVSLNINFAKT